MSLWEKIRRRKKLQKNSGTASANQPPPELKVQIRWLIRRDMPEVLDAENKSFDEASRWSNEDFLAKLRRRDCIGMVAVVNDKVVGFFIYELKSRSLLVTDIAVHPDFRKQGIGRAIVDKLKEKLSQQTRNEIIVLLPDECEAVRPFFMKYGGNQFRIRTTDRKGKLALKIVIKPMRSKHIVRAQMIEDWCVKEPRNLGSLLGRGTYGAVACNARDNGAIVGYALWEESEESPDALLMSGSAGEITHPEYFHKGIGTALMEYVAHLKKTVIVANIDLEDAERCDFLRGIGIPVPEQSRYMTMEWRPKAVA